MSDDQPTTTHLPEELAWLSRWHIPDAHIAYVTGASVDVVQAWETGAQQPTPEQLALLQSFLADAHRTFPGEPAIAVSAVTTVEPGGADPDIEANRAGRLGEGQRARLHHLGHLGILAAIESKGVAAEEGVLTLDYKEWAFSGIGNVVSGVHQRFWYSLGGPSHSVPEAVYDSLKPAAGRQVRLYATQHGGMPVGLEYLDSPPTTAG